MRNTITVSDLIGMAIINKVDLHTTIMTDSGWECDETEVDTIYYNPKTKVLMLTRKNGNAAYKYENCDDWKLLWKHPDILEEDDEND